LNVTIGLRSVWVTEVIPTADETVGFKDLDVALLVGAMPRREGMERKDLLNANAKIFQSQGAALDKYAKKTVKVSCFSFALMIAFKCGDGYESWG